MITACFRFSGDIDGFVKGSESMYAAGVSALHTISPVEILVNASGDRAISESTGSITIRFTEEGTEYDLTSISRFLSRLVKVDDAWKMLSLECIYVREAVVPAYPTAVTRALDLESKGPERKSYRYLGALLATLGYAIPADLPGMDDSESIQRITGANAAWIAAK
ncbi:hypothetical protein AYO22_08113 [Fonsecaea multimorphosa]|nr:hypothetical protein AYO22_08113 [Fonsecaea multimorphosa]